MSLLPTSTTAVPLADVLPWSASVPSTIVVMSSFSSSTTSGYAHTDSHRHRHRHRHHHRVFADGRFVLYELVSHRLLLEANTSTSAPTTATTTTTSSFRQGRRHSRVLWLSCRPVTPRHVANGLRRIGLSALPTMDDQYNYDEYDERDHHRRGGTPASQQRGFSSPSASPSKQQPLTIRCLPQELGNELLKWHRRQQQEEEVRTDDDNDDGELPSGSTSIKMIDREDFVRHHLLSSVRDWVCEGSYCEEKKTVETEEDRARDAAVGSVTTTPVASPSWIVVEDADALGALLGDRLASGFLQSLQGLACSQGVGLVVQLCDDDSSSDSANFDDGGDEVDETSPSAIWIGASGGGHCCSDSSSGGPQLSGLLAEMADHIVDVGPLRSGPTRDAHGRLVLTSRIDASSPSPSSSFSSTFNYCLTDNKALAVQIRHHKR